MQDVFDAYSIKVRSPSGNITVVLNEDKGKLVFVQIYVGKTGSILYAWTNAVSELITTLIQNAVSLDTIMSSLANITSDRLVKKGQVPIRSDVDAIVYALGLYKKQKFQERNNGKKIKERIILRQG